MHSFFDDLWHALCGLAAFIVILVLMLLVFNSMTEPKSGETIIYKSQDRAPSYPCGGGE